MSSINAICHIVLSLPCLLLAVEVAHAASAEPESDTKRHAVAAPNLRLSTGYAYFHVDRTRTSFSPNATATTTLRIGETDRHVSLAEIAGTTPITDSIGARGGLRGQYAVTELNQDLFGPGNEDSDAFSYGAFAEIFVRDPDLGSLAMGSSFDRLEGDYGVDANDFGASADARIFIPDQGAGPVDWFVRFDYVRREFSSSSRQSELDVDFYTVAGGAGWYLTDNFQIVLGGRWSRSEGDVLSIQDREGTLAIRWLLPVQIPIELNLGGSAGVSEFEESPFPTDRRLIYGGSVRLVIRFQSGRTLAEMVRAYD